MSLSNAELEYMREDVESLLPDTCAVLSATVTNDGAGGFTEAWGTVTASVACRIDAISGKEQLAGGAIDPFHRYVLTVPYDTTLTTSYRIEHGDETYSIISVDSDKSWATCRRAIVEQI